MASLLQFIALGALFLVNEALDSFQRNGLTSSQELMARTTAFQRNALTLGERLHSREEIMANMTADKAAAMVMSMKAAHVKPDLMSIIEHSLKQDVKGRDAMSQVQNQIRGAQRNEPTGYSAV